MSWDTHNNYFGSLMVGLLFGIAMLICIVLLTLV